MKPMDFPAIQSAFIFRLQGGNPVCLRNAKGFRLRCVSGVVLITAYKETRDIALGAGEIFAIPNNGLILMEGISPAHVELEPLCVRSFGIRLRRMGRLKGAACILREFFRKHVSLRKMVQNAGFKANDAEVNCEGQRTAFPARV